MTDIVLKRVMESASKLVLGHDPVPGAIGFRIGPVVEDGVVKEGQWAHTWDGTQTSHTFAPGHEPYTVEALMAGPKGSYPSVKPPDPDPTPNPTLIAPKIRTNYKKLNLGGVLDALWLPDGKHTGSGATIEIVDDPVKGHVQRHIVHKGDVLWGGDRCEVMTPKIGGGEGSRFQIRFELFLPTNFSSDGGGWNSLWDMHYPNNGPAQSPLMAQIRNGNELWMRVFGGPLTSDRTMGSVRNEQKIATLNKGVWNELGFDILMDAKNGIMDSWVNKKQGNTWGKIPTVSPNCPNVTYWKQGFYRGPNNSAGTQEMRFADTLVWFEKSPDAMLNWVE